MRSTECHSSSRLLAERCVGAYDERKRSRAVRFYCERKGFGYPGNLGCVPVQPEKYRKRSGCFWPISDGVLISNIGKGWSSGSQTSLTSFRYFCRFIHFRSDFHFQFESCFRNSVYATTFPRS